MPENKLLEQKKNSIRMAVNRQEGPYVPTLIENGAASIAWLGKTAIELLDDPVEYVTALNKVYEVMWADGNILSGNIFTPKMETAFDTLQYKYGPDGITPEHIQDSPMKADEYDQLIADPDRYVYQVALPRRLPALFGDREAAKRSLKIFAEDRAYAMGQLSEMISQNLQDVYGMPDVLNLQEMIRVPLDILFDYFRGFRGTLTDLRRQRANVEAAVETLWKTRCLPNLQRPVTDTEKWAPLMAHIPAYLSPKQYEELYWPHLKQQIEHVANAGGKVYILMEGDWSKIWHHFFEVPKDSCVLRVDDNDFLTAYQTLGQQQILIGGLKMSDVRLKSFHQIKDDVKRVIDECAPGGGFMFCTDKAWIAPGDVNQTLIDAFNFVHEYTLK